MQWIKWTLMAAAGCLPALAFAEEPAKPDNKPKIGLRIEVQTSDDKKPHVFVLGDGDSKDSKDAATRELAKHLLAAQGEQHGNKPKLGEVKTFSFTAHLREGKKATFLGVTTSAPPAVLSKQLGLHDGMGLVIDSVMHDSPAAKAGLQEYDVLQKIDDQLVVNQEQITVLVRSHKPGDEVKLTIIHEGKPVVVSAKLGEHELAGLGGGREHEQVERALRTLLPQPGTEWQIFREEAGGFTRPGHHGDKLMPGQSKPGGANDHSKNEVRQLDVIMKRAAPGDSAPANPAPEKKAVKESDEK